MPTRKSPRIARGDSRYDAFLRELKPYGLGISSASCSVDRRLYRSLRDEKKSVRSISARYKLEFIKGNAFEPAANLELVITDDAKEKTALTIKCEYQAHIHTAGKVSRELAERFTQSDFRLMVWPYFRQLVTDMSARMSVPPIVIPIVGS